MNNIIKRLEKSREFWLILGLTFFFFLLRIPSLFEPYWYGDEGIYETIGLALSKGRVLYTQIWDNKPPLLYYTYAIVQGDQFLVRLLSLFVGLLTVIVFFLLAKSTLKKTKAVIIATTLFTLFFGLPIFEGNIANAENFMLLFTISAVYISYSLVEQRRLRKKPLFLAGLLLSVAFLYKIVAVFDFGALFIFFLIAMLPETLSLDSLILLLKKRWKIFAIFILGFALPFLLSIIFFAVQGAAGAYIQATFLSTVGYVGYNNAFLIPQGLLISKLVLLTVVILVTLITRKKLSLAYMFIVLWVAFALFSSFFSQRPYTHYLLVLIAPISLLCGLIFTTNSRQRIITSVFAILIISLSLHFFDHWSLQKTKNYYTNFISFINGQKSVKDYYSFFDQKAFRDEQVATYINSHMGQDKSLFMWGNSAQLYYLTHTVPPGRFTVAYHIEGTRAYLDETSEALKKQPHFIIVLDNAPPYPFPMYNYRQVLKLQEANIYERTY